MVNKTISIPQEITEKLNLEKNQSALITRLLMDYYKYNIQNSEDATLAIKDLEEKKTQMIEQIEREKEKFVEIQIHKKDLEISESELKELKLKKRNELISNCIQNAKDIFNIEITIKQAEEYLDGDYSNLNTYLNIKDPIIEDAKQELSERSKERETDS